MSIFKNEGISGDGENTPLGIDTNYWTPYNETVLYSASSLSSSMSLAGPSTAFQRLRLGMVSPSEGRQYVELEPSPGNYTLHSIWGSNSGYAVDSYTRVSISTNSIISWERRAAWKNVNWAVNTTAAFNGASSATGELWCRNPIYEVIGINRKYLPLTLTIEFLLSPSSTTQFMSNQYITSNLTMYYKASADGEWIEMTNEQKDSIRSGLNMSVYGIKILDIPYWEYTTIMSNADYMVSPSEFQAKVTLIDSAGHTYIDATSEVGRYAVYAYIQENFSCTFSAF